MKSTHGNGSIRLPRTETGERGVQRAGVTPATIAAVVDDFYMRCRRHPELGPVFEAHVDDWDAHLARIRAFWEAALLGSGGYAGRPLEAHLAIPQLGPAHFSAWLRLFRQTVGDHCTPAAAEAFMDRAGRMANRMMFAARREGGDRRSES